MGAEIQYDITVISDNSKTIYLISILRLVSEIRTGTAQKVLIKIQRVVCLGITEALRTTPTAAIEVFLNINRLHIYIKRTALEALRLVKTNTKRHLGESGHLNILNSNTEIKSSSVKGWKSLYLKVRNS